ncbi:MAG TPA: esterase [Acetobacteraceae bacterium]|jgi:poly(hydroxyalkanoate) depolymerase family esterase|nr:esterase [Acetobacteraceae bacterium]
MKWSENLRSLYRGIKLGTGVAKATLTKPRVEPRLTPLEGGRLVGFDGFGQNPGKLRMLAYVPTGVAGSPLVVLLHGCGQDATAFAVDSGWIELADRLHFPLVIPEQAEANNAGRCFQWFHPRDTGRGEGEAASIASMTHAAIRRFQSDPRQIFIVGLSAGGAMAAAMLAAYPDLYAAGASVAGLPVGAARSGMQAMMRMASAGPEQSPEAWADHVRAAAPDGFTGPWPRLSVWQGQGDTTVAPENAHLLTTQWRALHGLAAPAMAEQVRNGVQHRVWPDGTQRAVELWSLPHLAHAYPAGTRVVPPGRFVEQAPVDATAGIARFFGLD